MQPLVVNPIDKDINCNRYKYRDLVFVESTFLFSFSIISSFNLVSQDYIGCQTNSLDIYILSSST
jgi:hypothetical protein